MSTLTKEWLLKTIAELEEERDAVPGTVNEDAARALAAMKLALASLEAEPVAYIIQDKYERERGTDGHLSRSHASKYVSPEDINEHEIICTALFKAPPLAHSVPDEWTFQNTQRYREDTGRQDAWSAMWGWNACRAAMLQGAEPVKEWIPCSERMPERDYVLAADFSGKQYPANLPNIQIGIYADWFGDGCPCWDDGDGNDLHLKQVTHWAQIPAAPQQEAK
nr:MAG TPA: Protein of unknown function (DUF551) [Caudoviricetes sp.]